MATLKELIAAGDYTLIDVREPLELDVDGSIDEAINIPLGEIENRKNEVEDLDGNIIFFCRGGHRAQKAVDFFKKEGLNNVFNGGGYEAVVKTLDQA